MLIICLVTERRINLLNKKFQSIKKALNYNDHYVDKYVKCL
jgi:hypothetical protein